MEHSAVIDAGLSQAIANLNGTYLELGLASPGGRVWREYGFIICTGSMEHAICNFALDLDIERADLAALRNHALSRRAFCVYGHSNGEGAAAALAHHGFRRSHELRIMMEGNTMPDPVELNEVTEPAGRKKIADFMADQFFHRQPTGYRRGIADTTAVAPTLRLLEAAWNGRTAGAVMISEHAGVVGIYNLCVAPQFRSRGWGSAIVRTVVAEAKNRGRSVTLQCEPSLASWYASLGFKEVGSVSVYGLCRLKEIDIMGLHRS